MIGIEEVIDLDYFGDKHCSAAMVDLNDHSENCYMHSQVHIVYKIVTLMLHVMLDVLSL